MGAELGLVWTLWKVMGGGVGSKGWSSAGVCEPAGTHLFLSPRGSLLPDHCPIAHTRLSIIVVGRPDISLGFPLFSKIVLFLLGSKSHFAASKLKGGLQALTFCQELVV